MPRRSTVRAVTTIGIDMGKNTLHIVGLDWLGAIVLRERVSAGAFRVRSRLVSQRTAVINQIRGFLLERGIIVRQGLRFLRQLLPDILAKRTDVHSPRMVRIVSDLAASRNEEMEKRSRQRVRDQVAHMAFGAES